MRKPKDGFWGDTTIKQTLFWTIWTLGICGWIYFGVSFTETRAEANWTYQESIKLKVERIENIKDAGGPVGVYQQTTSTEPSDTPINPKEEVSTSSGGSGEIEKLIYEVAEEKKFENPEILVRIAKAESSFDPCAKNPNSSATGLFQILDMHGLTKDERCNPEIATAWAIDHFNDGRPWNSSRNKWDNS